jgi:hypothetical protein
VLDAGPVVSSREGVAGVALQAGPVGDPRAKERLRRRDADLGHDRRQELRHDTCWQGYQRLHDFIYAVDTYQTVKGLERAMHEREMYHAERQA